MSIKNQTLNPRIGLVFFLTFGVLSACVHSHTKSLTAETVANPTAVRGEREPAAQAKPESLSEVLPSSSLQARTAAQRRVASQARYHGTLESCQKRSDIELAKDYLNFILFGGFLGVDKSRCAAELKALPFLPIEPFEGDVVPRQFILSDSDVVELNKIERLRDEYGYDMNTLKVTYTIHTNKRKVSGVVEISPSQYEEDVKNFGCAYHRVEPEPAFVRRRCLPAGR
ncbi:MAG: hypothetical protein N2Z70_00100 [Bdellovibrionaceae bacterium]|jgi:hypothetical protein|nr:hypothetical protein [Pseudobdellovibrionaceae bacterium]